MYKVAWAVTEIPLVVILVFNHTTKYIDQVDSDAKQGWRCMGGGTRQKGLKHKKGLKNHGKVKIKSLERSQKSRKGLKNLEKVKTNY